MVEVSCDITAVFGLLRDTAVTNSYEKRALKGLSFPRYTENCFWSLYSLMALVILGCLFHQVIVHPKAI